jgi:acyl carrier protein
MPSDEEIQQKVIDIVIEQLGLLKEEVDPTKAFVEDLNADSLDLTELIMSLEEAFGCEITEKEAAQLKTVGDAIEFIKKSKEY